MLSGPAVASSNAGFTGAGYVDYTNASADFVNWSVNVPRNGLYQLKFRYAPTKRQSTAAGPDQRQDCHRLA